MRGRRGLPVAALWKSTVFVVTTTLATAVLAFTILNGSSTPGTSYRAVFSEAPSLNPGDDVRISGVRVGQVTGVEIVDHRLAQVTFTVDEEVELRSDVEAEIRFRNLIGQRYLALVQGSAAEGLGAGATIPLDRTRPALDLTLLFNGFQPLFRLLSPEDVNDLSLQVIQVLQGDGSTVAGLIRHTAGLVSTLADRSDVIGEVITQLSRVVGTVDSRSDDLRTFVTSLQRLVSGFAGDRESIGEAVDSMGRVADGLGELLAGSRVPIRRTVRGLDELAGNLVDSEDDLDRIFAHLPRKLEAIGRTASYGSWINFYLCAVGGEIPDVEGYSGGKGASSAVERCGR
ncbi:MCE family protein [Nocardioides humilatus]|uniref:MCE family protein n=1 Tax=Nocardioides humilatus TaxID=2607660 RepID=A0A5B1LFZ2_9ACTN|nr:MlaD family protein [Nocardioides humilatus]KAA1419346.1 MCE family protein [Nocardioides humilatus]